MGKRCLMAVLLAVIIVPVMASGQTGMIAYVVHDPVTFALVDQPIQITASLEGDVSSDQVVEANIRFRNRDQESYDYVEMNWNMNRFEGTIPGEDVVSIGVEYYLEFEMQDGTRLTFPASNPEENPILVAVREPKVPDEKSAVLVITPSPDEVVTSDVVLVAIAFNPAVRQLDPGKVALHVDGKDRTAGVTVTDQVLTGFLSGLNDGRHRIDLVLQRDGRPEILSTWFFTSRSPKPQKEVTGIRSKVHGSVSFEGQAQRFSGLRQNVAREYLTLRGKFGNFSAAARVRLSSEEQGNLQPQHRYMVSVGMPWWRVRVGDVNPRYNELALWGRRVRGVELNLLTGPVNVYAVYGDLKRAVESRVANVATSYDSLGNIENVDSTLTMATYRRWIGAVRLTFGVPDRVIFGMMLMKAKDDTSSIEVGKSITYPKDNLVNAVSLETFFDRKRIALKGEAALSLYNGNTLVPTISDAESYKNIIWINQYFEPLPDEGLPDSEDENLDTGQLVNSILENSLSYQARLRLRYFRNDLRIGLRRINRSYITLGNPSLIRDNAGWYLRDRVRLMNSKLYLNLGFQSYHDNLLNRGDFTLTRNEMHFGFSFYTGEMYPDISFTYRNQLNRNDGEIIPVDSTQGIYEPIDNRIENATNMFNFGLSHRLYFSGTNNQFSLGVITSKRDDRINPLGGADQFIFSLGVITDYQFPLTTRINLSSTRQKAIDGLTDIRYTTFNVRADYPFLNRKLVPYFGPRITIGKGDNGMSFDDPALALDPADYADQAAYEAAMDDVRKSSLKTMLVDFVRVDWIAGAEYKFLPNHSLAAYISLTSYADNSSWEYWNGAQFDASIATVDNDGVTVVQPKAYDRNDYLASIMYTYRF